MGAHQELGGEIRDRARAVLGVGFGGTDPAMQHAVAHRVGERHVVVVLGGQGRDLALHVKQVIQEGVLEGFLAQGEAVVFEAIVLGGG